MSKDLFLWGVNVSKWVPSDEEFIKYSNYITDESERKKILNLVRINDKKVKFY